MWFAPPLKDDALVQAPEPTTIVRYIISGTKTPPTPAHPTTEQMPAFGERLDDQQIADVASYIRGAWSNRAASVSASDVAKVRAKVQAQARSRAGPG